jgi:pilus assembly protein FimV
VELRTKFFGLVLLGAAVNSGAMTLGRVRGAAIIGQPLDITIQAQLDPDESAASLCLEADVFHADSRQDASRVKVSVDSPQQGQTANFRVFSSASIDEPVVTVYLRAGCTQKITRRYVLLADFASEVAPLAMAPSLPVVTPRVTTPAVVVDSGSSWSGVANPVAAVQPVVKPDAPAPVKAPPKPKAPAADKPVVKRVEAKAQAPAASAAKEPVEEKHAAGRTAGQSRLKLDPLVMLAERVASLESSSSVPTVEVLRESQKMESLESSVKALLALAAKNEANLLDMKVRLQKAESDRLPAEWVYGLIALLIACIGAAIFMWARLRGNARRAEKEEWWSASGRAPLPPGGSAGNASRFATSGVGSATSQGAPLASQGAGLAKTLDDPASEMDVSLVEMSESNFDSLMQSGKSHSALRKGPLPPPVPNLPTQVQPLDVVRSINSEQLFDVRQQAEFFVSLGQTDQAVRILENRISDNGESSPLIYLDLLKIFYTLGLKTDFRQFREDFNLLFNGRVPEFISFKDEGKSLEDYPHILAHITALWFKPNVLKVIEASIYRDPLDDKSPPFDLAAFRDLLLLHAIAQTNFNPDAVLSRPMPLTVTPPSHENEGGLKTQAGFARVSAPVAPALVDLELDLDLSDLEFSAPASSPAPVARPAVATPATSAAEVSLPKVDDNLLNFDLPDTGSSFSLPKPKN